MCLSTAVPDVILQRGGGGGGGGVVCEHLIKVNNCCYGHCYGKSHTLPIRFLKFHCFNAGNRVRFFQDSIPKCLKVTILPFSKKVTFATEHHLF